MNPAIVSSILKEGMVISTRLGSNITWHKNVVYKSEDDTVCLCLLDRYLEHAIMPGLKIILKHTNELFEYLFECIVTSISPQHPAHISVTVQKAEELVNTRAFPRYTTHLSSTIRPAWDENWQFSIITNICLGGIAFLSKHEFDYGEESEIRIFLPQGKSISCKGKIIRKISRSGIFDYSTQFIDMTEHDSLMLSDYLTALDEISNQLQDHFSKDIKGKI